MCIWIHCNSGDHYDIRYIFMKRRMTYSGDHYDIRYIFMKRRMTYRTRVY